MGTKKGIYCALNAWNQKDSWNNDEIVRPQKWFLEKKNILRDVNTIQAGCTNCAKDDNGQSTCGLHVHVSHPDIKTKNDPGFGIWLMDYWANNVQDDMIKKWQLRQNNTFCRKNYGSFCLEKN